jgi:hypothetical protein
MIRKLPAADKLSMPGWRQFLPDLRLGLQNLVAHKLRTLLTMLGMIFGVAAVVSMLSIGAGAQQKVMAFIEQLGVRNLIVEAREANNWQEVQKVRKLSQGLSFQDLRVIRANVNGISEATARAFHSVEATPQATRFPSSVWRQCELPAHWRPARGRGPLFCAGRR